MLAARLTFSSEDSFHTLEIDKATLEDCGTYSVSATNKFGSVACKCHLVVDKGIKAYIAPQFSCQLEPSLCEVNVGGELRLSARVEAYPSVGVMWYKDGVRLRPSRHSVMTLSYDGRVELAIGAVTPKDRGVYTCVATNVVGRSESSATVEVLAKEGASKEIEARDIP